jgi:hypothetical protein
LARHPQRHFLQVEVADLVAVNVVYLLESIQIDVDQPENAGIFPGMLDARFEQLVEGEPVVQVGEQVEFRAVEQVGIEPPGLNGQRGQACADREGFEFESAGWV